MSTCPHDLVARWCQTCLDESPEMPYVPLHQRGAVERQAMASARRRPSLLDRLAEWVDRDPLVALGWAVVLLAVVVFVGVPFVQSL